MDDSLEQFAYGLHLLRTALALPATFLASSRP
jgi:hypothetical protein